MRQMYFCTGTLCAPSAVQVAEYSAIREELYFLRPLRNQLASLLFWMTILLWFQVGPLAPSRACQAESRTPKP